MTLLPTRFEPSVAFVGNLGTSEILFLVFLFFLFFGAKKIPELMRSLGRAQGEFNRAKRQFEKEVREAEHAPDAVTPPLPSKDPLDAARKRAVALGIETEGKDLEALKREIGEKVIAGDA